VTYTPTEREGESIWTRLRRRKVVQWGFAYVAAVWGLLQGLQFLADIYGWPVQLLRPVTLALALGLPIVVTLAWYHGDRGEQRIHSTELAIISLLFLASGGIFWLYDRGRESDSERDAPHDNATGASPDVAVTAPDAKSIAVLPFADMSPAKDQEYMSDGIAEELLNHLARVHDLKVIARTSSFAFKGEKLAVADIAKKLNVAHVVEGSVRKSGSHIRITAQLVRAADNTRLWSETYDRDLNDIFAVQDEIAGAIAQAFQIKLRGGELSRHAGGTQNLEAFELYLRASNATNKNTDSSLNRAGEYLEGAVKLDPSYGAAWLGLAENFSLKADSGMLDPNVAYPRAQQLVQHAMQLSPGLAAAAHSWLQYFHQVWEWDWAAAEIEGDRAMAIDPLNPEVLEGVGILSRALGRWDDAQSKTRAALERDPMSPYLRWNLAATYYFSGQFAEAEREFRKVLELEPTFGWGRHYLSKAVLAQGRPAEALTILMSEADEGNRLMLLPIVLQAAGRKTEADDALKAQIARWADSSAFTIAMTYAYRGERDAAMHWLERAYTQRDATLTEIVGEPLFDNVVDDPRFKAFLRKMKLPDWPRA
jgi:TolB-like protein/Flp pilus assembly protein TadD